MINLSFGIKIILVEFRSNLLLLSLISIVEQEQMIFFVILGASGDYLSLLNCILTMQISFNCTYQLLNHANYVAVFQSWHI